MELNRRDVLRTAAALGGAAVGKAGEKRGFRHRGYLGWIVDIDARAEPNAPWPSIRLDQNLVNQYRETFWLMRQLGYNEAVIWGIYVGRNWTPNLQHTVTPERARLVNQMLEAAHKNGLRVLFGLGVFSWGFEELIRLHPALGPTNEKAMCASNPEAWRWMERIATYAAGRFAFDGVSMQSADLGRCTCDKCKRWTNDEYHVMINTRMADFLRAKFPKLMVAVSGWGMDFNNENSLPLYAEMSKRLDYVIDVVDSAPLAGAGYRRKLVDSLHCDFGTIGGPLVEPPLHWQRERWFLPTVRMQGEHLAKLAKDGGRACEYFNHIRANPGDEVTFYATGKVLSDVATPWRKHLNESLEELYGVRGGTTDRLAELFLDAETAYTSRMLNRRTSGDISLEPLVGDRPGTPVYLTKNLDAGGRAAYAADLTRIAAGFKQIQPDVPEKARVAKIMRCLTNVQADLKSLAS